MISKDILLNILSPYLDYLEDIPKLTKIFNLNFDIKLHIIIEEIFFPKTNKLSEKITYLDDKIVKCEKWVENGEKKFEQNFRNNQNTANNTNGLTQNIILLMENLVVHF